MDDIHLTAALLRAKLKELLENTAKKESVHKCESECGAEQPIYTESQLQQLIKTSLDKAKSWKDSGVLKENGKQSVLQRTIESLIGIDLSVQTNSKSRSRTYITSYKSHLSK
jgi:hypothetical protein